MERAYGLRRPVQVIAAHQPVAADEATRILHAADLSSQRLHVGTCTTVVIFGGAALLFLCAVAPFLPTLEGQDPLKTADVEAEKTEHYTVVERDVDGRTFLDIPTFTAPDIQPKP